MMNVRQELYEGQWVKYRVNPHAKEQKGFIVEFVGYDAVIIQKPDKLTTTIPIKYVEPLDIELEKDDYYSLIDIALLIGDVDWAKEVYQRGFGDGGKEGNAD